MGPLTQEVEHVPFKQRVVGCPRKKQEDVMKQRHKQLEKEGWIRELVADRRFADDAEKVYDLIGFEVLRLPIGKPCFKKSASFSLEKPTGLCEVVYIRPKKQREEDGEEDWE